MSKSKMITIKITSPTSLSYNKEFPAIMLSPATALFWYPENEYPGQITSDLFSVVLEEVKTAPESSPRSDIDVLFFKLKTKYEIKKITVEF